MDRAGLQLGRIAPWSLLAAAAIAIAAEKIRPWAAGQVGYDSAASVLYFERIVAGQRLEAFVSATPKALLTVVYGLVFTVSRDWRAISAIAVLVYGANVALAALLADRLAGFAAAGFAAAAFLGSYALLEDASAAYAVGWAVLGWLVAGLALTSARPRYAVAGTALLFAGLARFETLLVVGAAALFLIGATLASRSWPRWRPPRAAWLLLIGLSALPLQMLHDWLLTGDPFWAEQVPAIVSQTLAVPGPMEVLRSIASHYLAVGPLVLLAAVGAVRLLIDRRWAVAAGLAVIGPGICAFLVFLAFRHIIISNRYFYPADLAVLFAAAVGVASLRVSSAEALADHARVVRERLGRGGVAALAIGASAVIAFVLIRPYAPLDGALTTKIRTNLALFENEQAALPAALEALTAIPAVRGWPSDGSPRLRNLRSPAMLVPVLLRPRMAVDLDLPLTSIDTSGIPKTNGTGPVVGQLVYHDPRNDLPAADYTLYEVQTPTTIGAIRLVPLAVNPARRYWLLRVEAP